MILPILYDDSAVMIVNKPAGLATTRVAGGQLSASDILTEQFPDLSNVGSAQDSGVVHRLDNDTSGCLVVAKTEIAYQDLRQQFDAATIYKEYVALVVGHPSQTGHCDLKIVHDPKSTRRMRIAHPGEEAQLAHTEWEVDHFFPISEIGPAGYALVRLRISTGVRHQIRIHMVSIGHPLVGDRMYQSGRQHSYDLLHSPHHLLHAVVVRFRSPATGQEVHCQAPLPSHFEQTLKTLDETQRHR